MSLLTILGGCAGSKGLPPLAVSVPDDCERILQHGAKPDVKVGDDFRVVAARHRAAVTQRDAAIDKGRECVADMRKRYGGAE